MNASEAYARLRKLGVPVVETGDAAAALRQSAPAATKTLSRLAQAGLVTAVRHGTWWLTGTVDPYALPAYLTAPFESIAVSLLRRRSAWRRADRRQMPVILCRLRWLARDHIATPQSGIFSIRRMAHGFSGATDLGRPLEPSWQPPKRPCSTSRTCPRDALASSRHYPS